MSSDDRRLLFVDVARGLAILAMAASHVGVYLLDPALDPGRHVLVYVTLTLAAPLFLLLVGFSLALSYRAVVEGRIRRGAWLRSRFTRGIGLVVLGWLLNLVVAPGGAIVTGGILQTIGLSILLLAPLVSRLRGRLARDLLILAAIAAYIAFVLAGRWVHAWLAETPILAALLFDGFPPWPWIAMVMPGLSLGAAWLFDTGEDGHSRLMRRTGYSGVALIAAHFVIGFYQGNLIQLNVSRDYIVNGHWLPGYGTALWVVGISLLLLCAAYHLGEPWRRHVQWLGTLGRYALTAYVAHLLIICLVARDMIELVLDTWADYTVTTVLVVMMLIGLTNLRLAASRRSMVRG